MTIEQAISVLKNYRDYGGNSGDQIIRAIHSLVADAVFLSDIEQKIIHTQLWTIAWDNQFLTRFPHNFTNPGVVADNYKSNFYYKGSTEIVQAILKASEEGRL